MAQCSGVHGGGGTSALYQFSFKLVHSKIFSGTILITVLINTLFIGLQLGSTTRDYIVEWHIVAMDQIFLGIYLFEIFLKVRRIHVHHPVTIPSNTVHV